MTSYLVTKHCTLENKERMLKGFFRIGTTLRYARTEGGGLFTDKEEGLAKQRLVGDQKIQRMVLPGGNVLENFTTSNVAIAVQNEFERDEHVFCTSNGGYKLDRHKSIMAGTEGYPPNADYTCYIELDKIALSKAISLAVERATAQSHDMYGNSVNYSDRASDHMEQSSFEHSAAYTIAAWRAVFHKPVRFALEEEYRYRATPRDGQNGSALEPIDTDNLGEDVHAAFVAAIVADGSLEAPKAVTGLLANVAPASP